MTDKPLDGFANAIAQAEITTEFSRLCIRTFDEQAGQDQGEIDLAREAADDVEAETNLRVR